MNLQGLEIFTYGIKNQADGVLDLHIDGEIVDGATKDVMEKFWGDTTSVSYKSVRNQIEDINPKVINVIINSPGGHVGDALAIHDYFKSLEDKGTIVNRKGRGIIASAGTYLLMGNNSEMSENSFLIIHNVRVFAYGDLKQVKNQVQTAETFNNHIRDFYVNITGNKSETVSDWMDEEKTFDAKLAKEKGFVNKITGQSRFTNKIEDNQFPFNNKAILNIYNSYTEQNDPIMENSIADRIINAMKPFFDKLNLTNKKEGEEGKVTVEEFTTALTNSLKDVQQFDPTIVTNQITEAFNKIGENEAFKTAITNATKDIPTQIATEVGKLKNELIDGIADRLAGNGKPVITEKEETTKNSRNANVKNRFDAERSYFLPQHMQNGN